MILQKLNQYKEMGLLRSQNHPTLPLQIWNYTEEVQYDNLWDGITSTHRGTVRDLQGNLVAKPFDKFFNIEQDRHTESESFQIYDKLDGSLGILFNYNNEWILATRGSFTSEQAIKGYEILQKYDYKNLDKKLTYCLEIIYPQNRIVLDYGDKEALILLAIFDLTGNEYPVEKYANIFELAKKYDFEDYKQIQKLNWDNLEGFIVRFSNGQRCKIKFENYVELHRKLSLISEKAVWELICERKDIKEFLDIIPDEFHEQVKNWNKSLLNDYFKIEKEVHNIFDNLPKFETRKDLALFIKDNPHRTMLFNIVNKKDIHKDICKLIKPKNTKSLIFNKE